MSGIDQELTQLFPNQSTCNPFNMWSDADHAGCIRTRKMSGGVLMANKCCLTTYWGPFPSKEVINGRFRWHRHGETVEVWDEPNMLTLTYHWVQERTAKERVSVSSQERRHRPNVGRRANESCHRRENEYSHERHELPLLGR